MTTTRPSLRIRSGFDSRSAASDDGAACGARVEGDSPAAYAIVIVEDQAGNRVEGATVEIGDDTVETNAFGVASVAYEDDDFDDPDERKTLDVTVLDQGTRMTIEPGEDDDPLEEGSNIEVVSVEPAVADDGGGDRGYGLDPATLRLPRSFGVGVDPASYSC